MLEMKVNTFLKYSADQKQTASAEAEEWLTF